MQMAQMVTFLALFGAVAGARVSSQVTPTQQVVSMLEEMHAKGMKMVEEEKKTYATYAEWVDDKTKELGFSIKDSEAKIEELTAFATKADSDVAEYAEAIATLDAEINKLEAEKKEATEIRASENAEYLKVSQDLGESVDALERAIQVLSQQDYDRPQAEMLLQKMATTVKGMPRVLAAFLALKNGQPGAPEVAAYEFQSGGIVSMLEGLLKKFKGQLSDVDEDESNQAHQFSMTEMHLSDTIAKSKSDRDEKAAVKASTAAASAKAKGELAVTKDDKKADEELLSEIKATFQAKTSQFEANQVVRKEELEALSKAIEIISGDAVSGSYSDRINLAEMPAKKAVSLLQTSSTAVLRSQAAEFLKKKGAELNSKALQTLAAQIPANAFGKVIDMIETLIEKLKEEAAEEADHKAWCDEQLKANKLKREKKTAKSEMLMAEIEQLTSTISTLGSNIDKLIAEQAELTKSMAEANKIRDAEKAENAAIVSDAEAGAEAVEKALVILKEFYSKQAAFLQTKKQVPEMAAYNGMQSAKGGVVGMLEVILSDFTRLKAETTAAERAAASEYSTFMDESTASKEQKHKAEVQMKLDKDETEFQKSQTAKDLKATDAELAKANEYYAQLKPSCLEVKVSWEERVAGRKAEIAALKEAYAILDQKR